jgi:ankyrin repeat protein
VTDANPAAALLAAIRTNDTAAVRTVLERTPEVRARINEPLPGLPFDTTPLLGAVGKRNQEMIDVLIGAGADINVKSGWWAGGFGVLDTADPSLVPFLIERGAHIDAPAAAHLGMLDRLKELVSRDPALVHARGGDGQTPLHTAATVEIARYLVDAGADIDARDIDHESTPAQYMLRDRADVARYLVGRGCRTDILMASALGDLALVRRHLDSDPEAIRTSVSDEYFPKQNPRSGGTIYIWVLGAHWTAHVAARSFGHEELLRELVDRSPLELRLTVACELGDEAAVQSLLASHPTLARSLTATDRARLVHAARNNNTAAVRLMLAAGWPVDVRGQHGGTPLHWAAWHGNLDLTRELVRHAAPLDVKDADYNLTPLGWAIYGSKHGWNCKTGDYISTVNALLDAGSTPPDVSGDIEASDEVRALLRTRAGLGDTR